MQQANRLSAESDRAKLIRQFCTERNITKLVHFTRIENLRRISIEGLLSREQLETRGQKFLFNDSDRVDGHKNGTCLSLNFPNYKMFYSIREEKKKVEEVSNSQWVVLLLDAEVLWELDCAFCQENASSKSLFEKSFDSVSHQVNGSDVNRSFSSLRIAFIVHSQATKPAKP